jgi:hypothetical protein
MHRKSQGTTEALSIGRRSVKPIAWAISLLLVSPLTGCLERETIHVDGGVILNGLPFPVPLRLQTTGMSGLLAYRIESSTNASFHLRYDFVQDSARLSLLSVAYVLDDGGVFFPPTLAEYPLGKVVLEDVTSPDAYVGAGPLEYATPAASRAEETEVSGIDLFFTPLPNATLVITWANLESPARLEAFWIEGTEVRQIATSTNVTAVDLSAMRGGAARIGTPLATGTARDGAVVGEPGSTTFGIIRLSRGTGAGEMVVGQDNDSTSISLSMLGNAPGGRLAFTSAGPVELSATAGAFGQPRVVLVAATLPEPIIPFDLWYSQDETY